MKFLVKAQFLILLLISSTFWSQEKQKGTNFYDQGKIAEKNGNFRKSLSYCLEGLKEVPDNLDLKLLIGKNYIHLRKLDSARYFFQKVLKKDNKNNTARRYLINTEVQSKRFSSAVCYVNELLEVFPYDKDLWFKKVSIYKEMNNLVETERAIKRLRQIYPKDEEVIKQYKFIISEKDKENTQLSEAYSSLLKEFPSDKQLLLKAISEKTKNGELNSALYYLNKALAYYPLDLVFIKKKIGALEELNRYNEAIVFLKKVRKVYLMNFI